jgi:hypothetical protein
MFGPQAKPETDRTKVKELIDWTAVPAFAPLESPSAGDISRGRRLRG